jgi:hypothetical protein
LFCAVRNELVDRLDKAIRAYTEAIEAMKNLHGQAFRDAQDAAKSAKGICDEYRADLKAHDRDHGCVTL